MRSEQRAGRDAEILCASAASETRCTIRAPAVIGIDTAAGDTDRRAIRLGLANGAEGRFDLCIGHLEHAAEGKGLCRPGK